MATKYLSKERMKTCNICGEEVLVFTIQDNAPLCNECVPVPKPMKKILNEKNMLSKILEGDKR